LHVSDGVVPPVGPGPAAVAEVGGDLAVPPVLQAVPTVAERRAAVGDIARGRRDALWHKVDLYSKACRVREEAPRFEWLDARKAMAWLWRC
jgi:hypothetical protein